jgi:hypothetical protein
VVGGTPDPPPVDASHPRPAGHETVIVLPLGEARTMTLREEPVTCRTGIA